MRRQGAYEKSCNLSVARCIFRELVVLGMMDVPETIHKGLGRNTRREREGEICVREYRFKYICVFALNHDAQDSRWLLFSIPAVLAKHCGSKPNPMLSKWTPPLSQASPTLTFSRPVQRLRLTQKKRNNEQMAGRRAVMKIRLEQLLL